MHSVSMGKTFRTVLAGFMAAALCSCAFFNGEPEPEETMTVNVDFSTVHLCSRISPEITVTYAPEGTKFYDVRLFEYGENERFLGGGVWPEDGSGVIPEGGLTRHYMGPCPPKDQVVEYAYVISAMPDENSQPLAVRLFRFKPE